MELRELKGVIRGRGLTYQELAGKAGMGVNTLSNKLNGKSDFDAGEIESVASVLGIGAADVARYFFPGMLEGGGAAPDRSTGTDKENQEWKRERRKR